MLKAILATALLIGLAGPEVMAREFSFNSIPRIQASTPDCRAYPEFPWIGRVSGNVQDDLFDGRSRPVSFVGCFPTQAECEYWKGRAGAIIDSTIIQYSCKPRR